MGKLPQIIKSHDIVGKLSKEAASILGLKEGIPVVAGGGDGACAAKGAGVVREGMAYNYIGSSSWISTPARLPSWIRRPEFLTSVIWTGYTIM